LKNGEVLSHKEKIGLTEKGFHRERLWLLRGEGTMVLMDHISSNVYFTYLYIISVKMNGC